LDLTRTIRYRYNDSLPFEEKFVRFSAICGEICVGKKVSICNTDGFNQDYTL
jgi:hypothetical protein